MSGIYNKENRCPKCGGGAGVSWNSYSEKLKRRCGVCGYGWSELPLDSDEAHESLAKQLGRMAKGDRA